MSCKIGMKEDASIADPSLSNEKNDRQPTYRQVARAERSRAVLEERRVPMYWHPLYVDDDIESLARREPEGRAISEEP